MRTTSVALLSALLMLAGCSHKPSGGELQKRYDDLCVAVERAEAKQADLRREAASYGRHSDEEHKQEELLLRLRKERDEAKAALDAAL
jgi:outer membrane murein-binding lipoprotein Lpp